jgi:transmembrane sensor
MSRVREAQDSAAQWIVARGEPGWGERDEAALNAWLDESDLNRIAWLRLDEGWRQADRMAALGTGVAPPADFESVETAATSYRDHRRHWWFPGAIAASLAAVVGLGWFITFGSDTRPTAIATTGYETPVGGHRLVGLSDGSVVELNTASSVRAAVGGGRREVWLDHGEAFFDIAHDASHPFVVHAGSRGITVLGTKFSVRREGEMVVVSVLEGRVRVDEVGNGSARSTTITGGDIAVAKGPATLVTSKSEERVEGALAWREGVLAFDQTRLADVATEFNRYNRKRLVVTGKDAAEMRISGTFPATRPRAFVGLLHNAYDLKVTEAEDAITISD